jgi:hypothetical protein
LCLLQLEPNLYAALIARIQDDLAVAGDRVVRVETLGGVGVWDLFDSYDNLQRRTLTVAPPRGGGAARRSQFE